MTFRGVRHVRGPGPADTGHADTTRPEEGSPMSTDVHPEPDIQTGGEPIDYRAAEGLPPTDDPPVATGGGSADEPPPEWRQWMVVGIGLVGLLAVLATIVAAFAFARAAQGGRAPNPGPRRAAPP